MRSKSSFFDRTVYRNVLARQWYIAPAYAVVMTYQLMLYLTRGGWQYYNASSGLAALLRTTLGQCTVICALGSVLAAMLILRWLFNTRHAAFVCALPVRREAVFVSQTAAGFTLLTAGNLFAILFTAAVGAHGGFGFVGIVCWMAVMTLLTVYFFGFASFCALLTGSILMLPALFMVLLYSAVALEASARLVAQYLVFGLTGQRWLFTALSPIYHLRAFAENMVETRWEFDEFGQGSEVFAAFRGWPLLLVYAAAGAVFFVLAVVLLRRRKMERAGAIVAVDWMRSAFCVGAALAGAFTLGYFTLRLVFGYSGYIAVGGSFARAMMLLAVMIFGAFLGWFGARGLMNKSVRVFNGGWKGFGLFAVLLGIFVLGLETDLTGLERHTPKTEDVGHATVFSTYGSVEVTELREKENIDALIALHKSVVSHKDLFERTPLYGNNWGDMLEICYYDPEGKLLFNRAYAAPSGVMAWSSSGNARATDGNAWGSGNPDLPALEALLNSREAVDERLTLNNFVPSAYTAGNGNAYVMENGMSTFSLELDGSEVWELYQECLLPDSRDSTLGQVRLLPTDDADAPRRLVIVNLFFIDRGPTENDVAYDNISLLVPADAARTNAWLADHGMPLPGAGDPAEPAVTSTYEVPALDGLAGLLEKIYLEYDPTTAGTVVSVRWARSLLEWYAAAGKDPAAAQEAAALFARRYVITESFLGSLARLRSAGESAVPATLVSLQK
ncbi:MAG: hypothetical protein J6P58_09005 [Oscillospiraceae bacterium]|nr:hypothetical protein [Oscillospiraceae bacterium]